MRSLRNLRGFVLAYLFPGILGTIGSVVGIASGLNSIFGGGGGGGSPSNGYGSGAPIYQPTGQGAADQSWQTMLQYLQGNTQQANSAAVPGFQQSLQAQQGINWNPYLQAAQQSGQASQMQGNNANASAGLLNQAALDAYGKGNQTYGAGLNTYLTSLDPQNALYDRTAQRLGEQVNAGQAQRGLGNSAQGAGEYDQAMSNFNIDWQNNELARQMQGMQALTQANNSSNQSNQLMGADLSGASNMLGTAASSYLNAGQTPLTAQQTAAAAPGQASSTYLQGLQGMNNLDTAAMQQILGYLGYGQNASSQATNAFNQAQNFNAGQTSSGMNALTQGLNSLSNNQAVNGWLTNLGNNYGNWSQQNAAQAGDPTSTVQNYPGA